MPLRSKLRSSVRAAVISFSPGGLPRRDGNLAQHQTALAGKSADHMQGRGVGGTIERAAQRLAPGLRLGRLNRQYPLTGGTETLDKAPETRRKGDRVQQPEQARERVMARRPVLQLEKLAEQRF